MPSRMPALAHAGTPTRRAVLRLGLGAATVGAATLLSGCGLRLEDDAPPVPFIPRKSIDDEALLIEGHSQARALAVLAAAVQGSELARTLAGHHERHATVLRGVLTDGGVPASVVEPTATGSPTAATTPSSPTTATLAMAEMAALTPEALDQLAKAVAQRTLLTAITAHRASAAALLGATPSWPAHPGLPADAATAVLEPSREAVYATEVAAARVPSPQRPAFLDLLAVLQQRVAGLQSAAGAHADGGALAYGLPFPVTTPDEARRLVRSVLDGLVARGLDVLPALPSGSASVTEVARLQAEAAVLRQQWGGPLTPFPGLVDG